MPRARPCDAIAAGKLEAKSGSSIRIFAGGLLLYSPPDEKGNNTRQNARMDDIDAVDHLGAPWTGKGLAQSKELSILRKQ